MSDVALPGSLCNETQRLADFAYRYSAERQSLKLEGALLKPITLHWLSEAGMKALYPGFDGLMAEGTDDVYTTTTRVSNPEFAAGALVHELTHIIHARIGDGTLPYYFIEGIAQNLQRHYDSKFSRTKGKFISGMQLQTPFLATVTADEAKRSMLPLNYFPIGSPDTNSIERLGCMFMEFLRTRRGGEGYPDYAQRIASITQKMPRMRRKDPAWRDKYLELLDREFGDGTEQQFFHFLKKTENDATARLERSVFASWLSDPEVQRQMAGAR